MKALTHASLFSGIGGPEVAATMLGWRNAFHCEINPFGRKVLEYWFPESVSYEDITKTCFKEWRGRIDVLTGGFPCQPFSYAGKRGGQKDERYLWPEMLRVIDEIRPTWVVGENVTGILTMGEGWLLTDMGGETDIFQKDNIVHNWILEQTITIDKVAKELEGLGYSVQPVLIPAAAVGAPHRRDRIFILAHTADTDGGDDVRSTGKNERTRKKEGLQKRNKVRLTGKSDSIRHPFQRTVENPKCNGCGQREYEVEGRERNIGHACAGNSEWICDGGKGICTSHADGKGLQESQQRRRSENSEEKRAGVDNRTVRPGCHEDVADPDMQRCDERLNSCKPRKEERLHYETHRHWRDSERMETGRRWAGFPTVAPVHRGNDGLPFSMDDLTIPPSRWRNESLKAYGNAIVPQVMYEIFRAIQSVESLNSV